MRNSGKTIVKLVSGAMDKQPEPFPDTGKRVRLTPDQGALVDVMMALVRLSGEENNLNPAVLASRKQLEKLVPVIEVTELDEGSVERELALIKVDGDRPEQVNAIADMYRGEVVDVAPESLTVEVTGPEEKIDAAISSFERFGVGEVVRTGTAAMARGSEDNQ